MALSLFRGPLFAVSKGKHKKTGSHFSLGGGPIPKNRNRSKATQGSHPNVQTHGQQLFSVVLAFTKNKVFVFDVSRTTCSKTRVWLKSKQLRQTGCSWGGQLEVASPIPQLPPVPFAAPPTPPNPRRTRRAGGAIFALSRGSRELPPPPRLGPLAPRRALDSTRRWVRWRGTQLVTNFMGSQ